jgi:uncharacterized protein YukE
VRLRAGAPQRPRVVDRCDGNRCVGYPAHTADALRLLVPHFTAADDAAGRLDPGVEHVSVLSDALDWLAGDPDQVNAHAQTWRNAAAEQFALAEEYERSVAADLRSWAGKAADAYRNRAVETVDLLTALGKSYETMSVIVAGAGTLVPVVRTLVRDLIAQCVSLLLYRIPAWSAMEAGSLGLATPYVAAQVGALVARFSTQIARLLHALVNSMSRLATSARQLDDLIATIRDLLRRRWGGSLPRLSPSPTHPNVHFGPLGKHITPGVVDPNHHFEPKERDIADRGVHVESVKRDLGALHPHAVVSHVHNGPPPSRATPPQAAQRLLSGIVASSCHTVITLPGTSISCAPGARRCFG